MMPQQTIKSSGRSCVIEAGADETTLLARVRGGDELACEEFVHRYGGAMLAVARRFLRCEQDAADAVQDAFLSAFRSIQEFAGGSKASTWLHRIVVNACLMKLRSAKNKPTTSIESLLPAFDETGHHTRRTSVWDASPLERMHTIEMRAKVRECIDDLPEPYRVVLLLRDIEERDTQEVAERLGISPAAVKVRLHRARQALRTLLEPLFVTDGERSASVRRRR